MPWCDECDEYLAPDAVEDGGTCPTCHQMVDDADRDVEAQARVPWHFWVVVIALVLYLGWRAVEGVVWLTGRF